MLNKPVVQVVLARATDDELFDEMEARGYRLAKMPELSLPEAERNTVPEEDWLKVPRYIEQSDNFTDESRRIDHLAKAVWSLYLLLEPPSVRQRRTNAESE